MAHRTQGLDADLDLYGNSSNLKGYKPESAPNADDSTYFTAEAGNMIQEEICNAVSAGGVTVSQDAATDRTNGWAQLAKSIFNNAAIATAAIANSAITTAKILNNAVTGSKISYGAGLSSTPNAADQLYVLLKLQGGLDVTTNSGTSSGNGVGIKAAGINENMLSDNSISTAKVQDRSIGQDQIALPAISEDHLFDNAVGYGKIDSNAVGTAELRADSVTIEKLAPQVGSYNNSSRTTDNGSTNTFYEHFFNGHTSSPLTVGSWYEVTFNILNKASGTGGTMNNPVITIDGYIASVFLERYAVNREMPPIANAGGWSYTTVFYIDQTVDQIKLRFGWTATLAQYTAMVNFKRLN